MMINSESRIQNSLLSLTGISFPHSSQIFYFLFSFESNIHFLEYNSSLLLTLLYKLNQIFSFLLQLQQSSGPADAYVSVTKGNRASQDVLTC